MVKLDNTQLEYIDIKKPDHIEIMNNKNRDLPKIFSSFIKSFNVVVEYLN
jgi:hypothetical protein